MPGEADVALQLPKRWIFSRKRHYLGYFTNFPCSLCWPPVLALVEHLNSYVHCKARECNHGLSTPLLGPTHACTPGGAGTHTGFPPLKKYNSLSLYILQSYLEGVLIKWAQRREWWSPCKYILDMLKAQIKNMKQDHQISSAAIAGAENLLVNEHSQKW